VVTAMLITLETLMKMQHSVSLMSIQMIAFVDVELIKKTLLPGYQIDATLA